MNQTTSQVVLPTTKAEIGLRLRSLTCGTRQPPSVCMDDERATAARHLELARRVGAVFQSMLENATRICDAQFGNLYLCEGDAFRVVAMHGAVPAYAEVRKHNPLARPPPDPALVVLPSRN